jgi:hypothetical protein
MNPKPPTDDAVAVIARSEWEKVRLSHIEWLAFTYGDQAAVADLVTTARNGNTQAVRALNRLEQVNPAALQVFLSKG